MPAYFFTKVESGFGAPFDFEGGLADGGDLLVAGLADADMLGDAESLEADPLAKPDADPLADIDGLADADGLADFEPDALRDFANLFMPPNFLPKTISHHSPARSS